MVMVYLSGPITGSLHDAEERFDRAERSLSDKYLVINPFKIGQALARHLGREPSYQEYMKLDLNWLTRCEIVYMLPGWELSEGAKLERFVAISCGVEVREWSATTPTEKK